MHILYSITSYPPAIGGTQFYTHRLASQFARSGHKVQVVTYWDHTRTDWLLGTTLSAYSDPCDYSVDGVPVHRLGLSPREKLRLLPFVPTYWLAQGMAIRQISALIVGKLEAMGKGWQVIHNVRQGREGLSYASCKLARSLGIPFVLTPVHHPRWGGWLHRHYQALYRMADAVIALTTSEKETLIGLGVRKERIHVTGMGPTLAPQPDAVGFRHTLGLESEPIVLFVGTHNAYKGLQALLQAARRVWTSFPSTRFAFIGPPTAYSRRLFARQTDPRLIQLGAVDLQTKTSALAACDLLCVPSTQESFGAVYTEAWMMGKPVIAGDIPATRQVVSDGIDGYLVRPDPSELADRISSLLADASQRQRMGQAGRAKVQANYTWERLSERTEQVYRHALQVHRTGDQ
jgi:glycosyltransferase involved in cell wall biosynthesis